VGERDDTALRERLEGLARAVDVREEPPAGLLAELGRRRRTVRRRRAAGAVVASIVAVTVLWGATGVLDDGHEPVVTSSDDQGGLLGAQRPLPDAPLSPRSSHSAVWTGDEMIIWGGEGAAEVFGDGAAFAPETGSWRTIAQAPIAPRARHAAAWMDGEMFVFGGTERPLGSGDTLDAAAYDPATDTWRTLTPLPSPRTSARTALVDGLIVLAGGVTPTDAPRATSLLVYDPTADRWSQVEVGAPVFDAVATGPARVSVLTMPPDGTGTAELIAVDVLTGELTPRPPLPVSGTARAVGLAAQDGNLVVAVTDDTRTTVLSDETDDTDDGWRTLADVPRETFTPGTRRDDHAPGFTSTVDSWLVARQPRGIVAIELRTDEPGAPTEAPTNEAPLDAGCGSRSTTVPAGSHLLVWGGGTCEQSSSIESAAGASIDLTLPRDRTGPDPSG
jgi:hypothetical protein